MSTLVTLNSNYMGEKNLRAEEQRSILSEGKKGGKEIAKDKYRAVIENAQGEQDLVKRQKMRDALGMLLKGEETSLRMSELAEIAQEYNIPTDIFKKRPATIPEIISTLIPLEE